MYTKRKRKTDKKENTTYTTEKRDKNEIFLL